MTTLDDQRKCWQAIRVVGNARPVEHLDFEDGLSNATEVIRVRAARNRVPNRQRLSLSVHDNNSNENAPDVEIQVAMSAFG